LVTAGQDFLAFQWDNLLLEAGFLAIFLAPSYLFPGRSEQGLVSQSEKDLTTEGPEITENRGQDEIRKSKCETRVANNVFRVSTFKFRSFLCSLCARWGEFFLRGARRSCRLVSQGCPPLRSPRWLLWFLLFRLLFSSGVVKLTSGDPTWRNLKALEYHYYTQPLPTPIAWYMHLAPAWFQHTSVVLMFLIEIVIPFLIFAPRLWRFVGAGLLILLQLLFALTGNFAFFNLLTIALCVLLFDDAFFQRFFPRAWVKGRIDDLRLPIADLKAIDNRQSTIRNDFWSALRGWVTAPVAVVIFLAGLLQLVVLFPIQGLPPSAFTLLEDFQRVRIVNGYGLFAVMTTVRQEIVIEGSNDGRTWLAYEFRFKPGNPRRAPRWVAPFQPRLDWQMWFAALADHRRFPWFTNLMLRLLQGSPPVLALFERNPFPQAPPKYLRARIYDYQFTDWATHRSQGTWWERRLLGGYFPAVTLRRANRE
jgi:hypothetical protein